MNPPTISVLQERLGLRKADAKCLRRLMGITMRRDSEPRDEGSLGAVGPYVNRNLVPAVLRFACWAMHSGATATLLVPDRGTGPEFLSELLYDRVAQFVVVQGFSDPKKVRATLWFDHMRSRWFVGTWDEFWASAHSWMGKRSEARVAADHDGPSTEHTERCYGAQGSKLGFDYIENPSMLAPGAVFHSDVGGRRAKT